jgi:hypothetical protein
LLDDLKEKKCQIDIVDSGKTINIINLKEIEHLLTSGDIKLRENRNYLINTDKIIILDIKQFVVQKKNFSDSDYVFKTGIINELGSSEKRFDELVKLFTEKLTTIPHGDDLIETIESVKLSKSFSQLDIDNYIYIY